MRNDIPDSISLLLLTYGTASQGLSMPTPAEDAKAWKELEDREFHDLIFQRGRYEPKAPEPVPQEPEDAWYTDPITGMPSPSPF
jgi:hypothetical protein